MPKPGYNRARERTITNNRVQPNWGYAWPNNRRVMYNRASAKPDGTPWSEAQKADLVGRRKEALGGRRRSRLGAG